MMKKFRWAIRPVAVTIVITSLFLSACEGMPGFLATATPTSTSTLTPTPTMTASMTATVTATVTASATATATASATASATPTPTASDTPTPTMTVTPGGVLNAVVTMQSNCRYGQGTAYLYKDGFYEGDKVEVVYRNPSGTWLMVQRPGSTKKCWASEIVMTVDGDVMTLPVIKPEEVRLPFSTLYTASPADVIARRNGSEVVVSWAPYPISPGKDSEQYPFLIEAWVCQGGQNVFMTVGSWTTSATVPDEGGCPEASHARLYAVEKHGYSSWIEISWP